MLFILWFCTFDCSFSALMLLLEWHGTHLACENLLCLSLKVFSMTLQANLKLFQECSACMGLETYQQHIVSVCFLCYMLVLELELSHSLSVAAPKIWNSVPPAIQMCTSICLDTFIITLKLTISSRPSNWLSAFLLVFQIWLLLTVHSVVINYIYLFTGLILKLPALPTGFCH